MRFPGSRPSTTRLPVDDMLERRRSHIKYLFVDLLSLPSATPPSHPTIREGSTTVPKHAVVDHLLHPQAEVKQRRVWLCHRDVSAGGSRTAEEPGPVGVERGILSSG